MGRDLLGANSFEESLHVVEMGEHQGVLVTMVRVNVSLLHVLQVLLVVSLPVFGFVYGLLPKEW